MAKTKENPKLLLEGTKNKYREYRSILILINQLSIDQRKAIDNTLNIIPSIPPEKVRTFFLDIMNEVQRLRKIYEITCSASKLVNLVNPEHLSKPSGWVLLISKHHLEKFIPRYDLVLPLFTQLPPHARIGIDVLGTEYEKPRVEISLLEASLFEDMAALWNIVCEYPVEIEQTPINDVVAYKKLKAIERSTVKAAFSLLEGYLNGLALDILLTQKVSNNDRMKLEEWDEEKQRPFSLSLRDKLLQYPKIALGLDHPPLQESNFQEYKQIIDVERKLRHALIHPNPQDKPHDNYYREGSYFHLSKVEVSEVCDLIYKIITRISAEIKDKYGTVDWWLYKREESGKYKDSLFL